MELDQIRNQKKTKWEISAQFDNCGQPYVLDRRQNAELKIIECGGSTGYKKQRVV